MLALLVVVALLVPTNQTDPELAARIHHLIDLAFSDDDAARDAADVRRIFRERGLPTTPIVGSEAAEEFIILSAHEQALEFTREILAAAERGQAAIPPHAVQFLRARIKQKAIETQLRQPYPNAALAARLNTLYAADQRAQVDDGKRQRYGANFACQPDGTLGPSPIDDVEHLDARRAEIGLLPMRLYSRLLLRSMPPDFCKKVTSPNVISDFFLPISSITT
jgi:hypothetical protein